VKLSRIKLTLLIHATRHCYSLRDAGYVVARHGSIEGMNEYIMRWIANEVAYESLLPKLSYSMYLGGDPARSVGTPLYRKR